MLGSPRSNPRRRNDQKALAQLAASIKARGVLQPILVRPRSEGGYEIVCGERRWQASRTAGKDTISAGIVHLADSEALELAVIENVQRENVHELDEALAYQALMKQDPELYTVEVLSSKIGRSPKYIYGRLKLAELTPNLQTAFYEGKLTAGHALEIARLQPRDQERALQECFPAHRTAKVILKDQDPRPISVRELRDWIEREIHLILAQAPFDVNDPNLLPAAVPCSTCPKRSGSNPLLFADNIKRADVCTDPECFKQKQEALVQLRSKELEAAGEKALKVSDSYVYYVHKPLPGVLYRSDYNEAKAGDCPATTAAVVVEGKRAGKSSTSARTRNARPTPSTERRSHRNRRRSGKSRPKPSAFSKPTGSGCSGRSSSRVSSPLGRREPFPPGDTNWADRRSRWRETEYMLREIRGAILPTKGLANTLSHWHEIARGLVESKRKRKRHNIK